MSNRPPAFMFYPDDFLVGATALPNAAKGAYINLLCHAWNQNPIGSLPDDDYRLFKMSGADSQAEWDSYKEEVMAKFEKKEGRWWNKRLLSERVKQVENNSKFSDRRKKGAAARWNKGEGENENNA